MSARTIQTQGISCQVEIIQRRREGPTAPRLIMVCYNQTEVGVEIARAAVESIRVHTPEPHELWVVDNASPAKRQAWLRDLDEVNAVLNHTPPVPLSGAGRRARWGLRRIQPAEQMGFGSFANAIGLELGIRAIDPSAQQVCVMHSDVLALHDDWLPFLRSRLSDRVRAASAVRDVHPDRIGALHVSCLLFDFTLFQPLQMTFMPRLPRLDVGDQISEALRAHGFGEYVCHNTNNEPELEAWIPDDHPLRHFHDADRVFDDERRLIFAHLGRGTPKAAGIYTKPGKTYPEQWLDFARSVAPR